jgi:aspartokinase
VGREAGRRPLGSLPEIEIALVIDEKYVEIAVRVLHKAFQLEKAPLGP